METAQNAQFLHDNTYGLTLSKDASKKRAESKGKRGKAQKLDGCWTIAEVVGELMRNDGDCPHVKSPLPPVMLVENLAPADLVGHIEGLVAQSVELTGHSTRYDAQLCVSSVASHPKMVSELPVKLVDGKTVPDWESDPEIVKFASLVSQYAQNRAIRAGGEAMLALCCMHLDEKQVHIHMIWPAFLDVRGEVTLGSLHPGQHAGKRAKNAANAAARNANPLKRPVVPSSVFEQAHDAAQKAELDIFFKEVGEPCGMLRISENPRERLPRHQHLHMRDVNESIKLEKEAAEAREKALHASILERDALHRERERELMLCIERQSRELEQALLVAHFDAEQKFESQIERLTQERDKARKDTAQLAEQLQRQINRVNSLLDQKSKEKAQGQKMAQ